MRVAYILYNERPLSGLVRTQVMSLLKEIKRQAPEISLNLVSFWQPWVMLKFRKELARMRAELVATGIEVEDCPWAIIPSRYFLHNILLFPIVHWWVTRLFRRVLPNRFDIVHCRSYFASLIAAQLKQEFGYRCIFDMRSLWPEEHVTVGTWTTQDKIYHMWKHLEQLTVALSDVTIGVTPGMVEEISRIVPDAKGVLIPIAVDTRELYFDEYARKELRQEHYWNNHLIVAYEGSLGLSHAVTIQNLAEYFAFILDLRPDAHFLILTPHKEIATSGIMREYGIVPSQFTVKESEPGVLHRWLSAADVGIHVMSRGPDSHTRLGVKVVEYLSCGLPVIVNSNVGAAASVVNTYHVGAVIDLDTRDEAQSRLNQLLNRCHLLRRQCREVAKDLFSVESCASKYIDLYRELKMDV